VKPIIECKSGGLLVSTRGSEGGFYFQQVLDQPAPTTVLHQYLSIYLGSNLPQITPVKPNTNAQTNAGIWNLSVAFDHAEELGVLSEHYKWKETMVQN
jgi:hypothetical protein